MIANIITISRIILSLILPFTINNNIVFYIIYSICGLTDILDGYIARKTKTQSDFGAKLDTIADLIFAIIIAIIIFPIIVKNPIYIVLIICIFIIKISSIIINYIKYKEFAILHTYGNKITGLTIFITMYFIYSKYLNICIYIVCFIAIISSIEELIINIKSKKLERNKKNIIK